MGDARVPAIFEAAFEYDGIRIRVDVLERLERDYQELKQEVGLGHFEGRGWRGFHHHATLCIAAYGFLISERETIPLRTSFHHAVPGTCRIRRLPTQGIRRYGPSVTSQTRSRPCVDD